MKKKIVSVLLCATMVTGLAMGCGKSSDSSSEKTSDGKTKIRMTYWNNEDTVKTLLDYLEKEVPDVKIEFQFIDNSNYDTVVDTQLSAEEGPGCGFAVNKSSKNKDAAMKVLKALSTEEGQKAFWEDNQGGSSYLEGAKFELPEEYASASKALEAGNVYCPWNEWGDAASAHETYGTEMQSYLLGEQDLDTTLKNVDSAVKELLEK